MSCDRLVISFNPSCPFRCNRILPSDVLDGLAKANVEVGAKNSKVYSSFLCILKSVCKFGAAVTPEAQEPHFGDLILIFLDALVSQRRTKRDC